MHANVGGGHGGRWLRPLLLAAASALALAGTSQAALAVLDRDARPAVAAHARSGDGIAATVTHAAEVGRPHEHDQGNSGGGQGFRMPLSMMPGMPPEGQVRMSVALTLANTAAVGRPIDPPGEFALTDDRTGQSWPAIADTFGGLPRLGPATVVNGTLFFDLPPVPSSAQLVVDWKRDGRSYRLAVPRESGFTEHSHES